MAGWAEMNRRGSGGLLLTHEGPWLGLPDNLLNRNSNCVSVLAYSCSFWRAARFVWIPGTFLVDGPPHTCVHENAHHVQTYAMI